MLAKTYKASTTIELAMMMPVLLLVINAVIYAGFYYHDKNIIYGKVYELQGIGVQQDRLEQGVDIRELEEHYYESVDGKLLLFTEITCDVKEVSSGLNITVRAKRGRMSVEMAREVSIYYVEQNIRRLQPIESN